MGFHTSAPQTQAHHRWRSSQSRRFSTPRPLREQGGKTAALLIELQLAVGRPQPQIRISVSVQPGATLAAQPTAQQAIVERDRSWHPATLSGHHE
jgi:hypothetical protein